jgi:hypothetical protein
MHRLTAGSVACPLAPRASIRAENMVASGPGPTRQTDLLLFSGVTSLYIFSVGYTPTFKIHSDGAHRMGHSAAGGRTGSARIEWHGLRRLNFLCCVE